MCTYTVLGIVEDQIGETASYKLMCGRCKKSVVMETWRREGLLVAEVSGKEDSIWVEF